MDKYITIDVQEGTDINLYLEPENNDTPIKIVSGDEQQTILLDTNGVTDNYHAGTATMTIYGDLRGFWCLNNGITGIDISHNTTLKWLSCSCNQLTALDVSHNTALDNLDCSNNQLTALDVSNNTALRHLNCSGNQLTALDVSNNTALVNLYFEKNQLTALDISHNTDLWGFDCSENQLTTLDISHNTALGDFSISDNYISNITLAETYPNAHRIVLIKNQLSTEKINSIFCALPDNNDYGEIEVYGDTLEDVYMYNSYLATNKSIATDKHWFVIGNHSEAANTTGDYVCGSGLNDISDNDINIYPNPAKDEIVLTNVFNEIVKIFDVNGRLVKQEIVNQRMNISDLQSGVYYLQIRNTNKKIIVK